MTDKLPDDGDVIEFTEVPKGSLIPPPIVTPEGSKPLPVRRYRVEHKPLDREYLLVDVLSGHAARVPAHTLKDATWAAVTRATLDAEAKAKVEAEKPAAASIAKPLSYEPAESSAPLFPSPPGGAPNSTG
jgi:hypothetical protein